MRMIAIVLSLTALPSCRDFFSPEGFEDRFLGASVEGVDYSMEADELRLSVDLVTQTDDLLRSSLLLRIRYPRLLDTVTVGTLRIRRHWQESRTTLNFVIDLAEFRRAKDDLPGRELLLPNDRAPFLCAETAIDEVVPFGIDGFNNTLFYLGVDENGEFTGALGYAISIDETKLMNAGFIPDSSRTFEVDGTTSCLGSYFSRSGDSGMAFFITGLQ